jgi:putative transposase
MIGFIDAHKGDYGVEPMVKCLSIAPSTYYAHCQQRYNPSLRATRTKRDEVLCQTITRIWQENHGLYGCRKIWHTLRREGTMVARCTVERLMRKLGLQGVVRGKKIVTTQPDKAQSCPLDKVNRQFKAERPNQLWISDFTYVPTWQGMVYVAFVIDVFARRIVGWRVSTSMTTAFVLDALNQAVATRLSGEKIIHHSDRGSQYLSITYTERLIEAGIEASVGSVGDSYDNAMAETIIGLFKTEVIKHRKPWKTKGQVEWETIKWVHWFNHKRILEPIGYITPTEKEKIYYENLNADVKKAA